MLLAAHLIEIAVLSGTAFASGLLSVAQFEETLIIVARAGEDYRNTNLRSVLRKPLILPAPGTPLRNLIEQMALDFGIDLDIVAEVHFVATIEAAVAAGLSNIFLHACAAEAKRA